MCIIIRLIETFGREMSCVIEHAGHFLSGENTFLSRCEHHRLTANSNQSVASRQTRFFVRARGDFGTKITKVEIHICFVQKHLLFLAYWWSELHSMWKSRSLRSDKKRANL